MAKLNIKFGETDVVSVIFTYRHDSTRDEKYSAWDTVDSAHQRADLKEYYYAVPDYLRGKLNVGDAVIVHCATGYQLAEIKTLNTYAPGGRNSVTAEVVAMVDMVPYFNMLTQKEALSEMKRQLVAEKKRLEAMVTYEVIAEKHPEFKELLDQFKAMGGSFD